MAREGYNSAGSFRLSRGNDDTVVADLYSLPEHGWITSLRVQAGGHDSSAHARQALWQEDVGKSRIWMSSISEWSSNRLWREERVPGIRMRKDVQFRAGFWRDPAKSAIWGVETNNGNHSTMSSSASSPPDTWSTTSTYRGSLTQQVEYTPNSPPSKGLWDATAASGNVGTVTPRLGGRLGHFGGDGGYDYTDSIHVRIFDVTTGNMVYNNEFGSTSEERNSGSFSRTFGGHVSGRNYWAEYRHRDSWGVYSVMSERTYYTISGGPETPEVREPLENQRLASGSGIIYKGTYSHPRSFAMSHVQVQVLNASGSAVIYDSGFVAPSAGPTAEGFFNLNQWHPALVIGTEYTFRMRVRDNTSLFSDFSTLRPFKINAAPYVPSNMTPSGGKATSSTVLKASIGDKNGDTLTATARLFNSAGTLILTKSMVIPPNGKTATLDVSSSVVFGNTYQWEMFTSDGMANSPLSTRQSFLYVQVANVSILAPSLYGTINEAEQPSAEYDLIEPVPYWTLPQGVLQRNDGNSHSGTGSWEALDVTTNEQMSTTDFFAVDVTKAFKLFAALKRISGDAAAGLYLGCYSADDVSLGIIPVFPNASIKDTWDYYGGFIQPSQYPAGTVKGKVVINVAVLSTVPSTNRVDSINFGAVEPGTPNTSSKWWGFFDGDFDSHGSQKDFFWSDEAGASASSGLSVLTTPVGVVVPISYSHPAGTAKTDDKILVEKFNGVTWVPRHVTNYGAGAGARTSIPIPSDALDSEARYRLKLWVKDATGLELEMDPIEFEVLFQGPPELLISLVSSNDDRAEIVIEFTPSNLTNTEFGGIEVEIDQPDGSRVLYFFTDPMMGRYVYPFPVSAFEHTIRVRQFQLISGESLPSRWSSTNFVSDYSPLFFLKDVEDPYNTLVGFDIMADSPPGVSRKRNVVSYLTWESKKPKHAVGKTRFDEGSIPITLFSDIDSGDDPEVDLAILDKMSEDMDTLCFLSQRPNSKRFIQFSDGGEFSTDSTQDYTIVFPFTETTYFEDYNRRGDDTTVTLRNLEDTDGGTARTQNFNPVDGGRA